MCTSACTDTHMLTVFRFSFEALGECFIMDCTQWTQYAVNAREAKVFSIVC